MDINREALKKLAEGTFIPAHPLALDMNRKLDEKSQRMLARYYIASGAGGIAVAVHTTQFEIRSKEINLLEPVLKIAEEEISAGEKRVCRTIVKIAGVCGKVKQASKEAELAKKMGYDAVLLSPGGLAELTEAQMLERTRTIASIIPVIGFYLQPSVGGRYFSYDYWQRTCDIDGVAAIKCASFNRYMTADVVRAAALSDRAEEITLYTGNDDSIYTDLLTKYRFSHNGKTFEGRFKGGLLGHWAVWTSKAVGMFEMARKAAQGNDIPSGLLTMAAETTDANAAFFDTANNFAGCISGINEVLKRQGLMRGNWCLSEKEMLSPGQMEEIDRVYAMYPHLNDDEFVSEHIDEWR